MASNLPAGVPPMRVEHGRVHCLVCDDYTNVRQSTDMGSTEWTPNECESCGLAFPREAEFDPYGPEDFDNDDRI